MGLWMRQVICSFSQRRVVTIRQIDDGTIAGQFSLVDWQQLDAIAAGVEQLLRDLGLVDAGCVEVGSAQGRAGHQCHGPVCRNLGGRGNLGGDVSHDRFGAREIC